MLVRTEEVPEKVREKMMKKKEKMKKTRSEFEEQKKESKEADPLSREFYKGKKVKEPPIVNGVRRIKTNEDMEWYMREEFDPIQNTDDFKAY